jgi:hypothetical protein
MPVATLYFQPLLLLVAVVAVQGIMVPALGAVLAVVLAVVQDKQAAPHKLQVEVGTHHQPHHHKETMVEIP